MKSIVSALFLLYSLSVFAQQKAMFTQYMFNPLAINPAYSAIDDAINITAVARQQWSGFTGAPNTQTISYHSPVAASYTSLGFLAYRDQIGEEISETGAFFTLSQKLKLSDNTFFAVGFNGGVSQYQANYSQIRTPLDIPEDPYFADQNDTRINLGAGLLLYSEKFYVGLSSPFLYISDPAKAHSPFFLMHGGYLFDIRPDLKFKPNFLVKQVSGSQMQVDLNVNFLFKETLWLGASYRTTDSIDFLAKIQVNKNLGVGYSYDFTLSKLAEAETGSHEIMLNYRLPVKRLGFKNCYF